MAELLIYASDDPQDESWDADTIAVRQRPGDVIAVGKNKHRWGLSESKAAWIAAGNDPAKWHGKFVVVKVPQLSVAKARKLLGQAHRPLTSADPEFQLVLPGEPPLPEKLVKKFQWRINIHRLPAAVRRRAMRDGELKITLAQLRTLADHNVTRHRFNENAAGGRGAARTAREQADEARL